MKVVLEVPRFSQNPFGSQTYYEESTKAFLRAMPDSWQVEISSTGLRGQLQHVQRLREIELDRGTKTIILPFSRKILEKLNPAIRLLRGQQDIVHNLGWTPYVHAAKKYVVTILDLIPLTTGEGGPTVVERTRELVTSLTRSADAIVTVSESSKKDIQTVLEIESSRVHVLPHGFNTLAFKPAEDNDLRSTGLPYLIHIGGSAPRKNLVSLLTAFEKLKKTYSIPHRLVLVGVSKNNSLIQQAIAQNAYRDEIDMPGYLSQTELVSLLQGADAMVFPSVYEGFGMPPVEAMACGVRVAISNTTSLPEVGGDVAVYFDPLDTDQIAAVVYDLLSEPKEQRDLRVRNGILRCQQFSWEKTGVALVKLYEQLLT